MSNRSSFCKPISPDKGKASVALKWLLAGLLSELVNFYEWMKKNVPALAISKPHNATWPMANSTKTFIVVRFFKTTENFRGKVRQLKAP
jgi:hypothetical protein